MTTSATKSWLTSKDHADIAFVLLIEGYNLAYVSHDDVAGLSTAWTSATAGTGPWSNFKGGLEIVGVIGAEFQLFNAQLNPSSLSFTVVDVDDTLIGTMFADSSSAATVVHLSSSIDADDTVIAAVEGFGSFSAAPTVYIGTEEISTIKFSEVDGYGGSTSYLSTGSNGRGIRSLFGTSRGSTFGQAHLVDEATNDRPEIATAPRRWINRNVGLYVCHRVNGTWSAGLPGSSTNDAELLWTGRIKSYSDLGDGRIQIDCIDVLDRLKTTLGNTPFQGTLGEGLPLVDTLIEFRTRVLEIDYSSPTATVLTEYDATVDTWAVPGTTTNLLHGDVATAINFALLGRFASTTYAPAGLTLVLVRETGADGKYVLRATLDGLAATTSINVGLWLAPEVWELLGWKRGPGGEGTLTSINSLIDERIVTIKQGSETGALIADHLPLKHVQNGGNYLGAQSLILSVENVVNGTSYWPQTDSVPEGLELFGNLLGSDVDGFLQVGKMIFAVGQLTDTTFRFVGDITLMFSGGVSDYKSVLLDVYADGSPPVQVRQVWLEAGTIGEIFLRLLASTGTPGYNHPTYDVYPPWMSAGIPWQLIDWQSVLGMGTDPYLLVVTKPTPLLTLLESALNFVGKNLVFKDGKLTVVTVGEAAQGASTLVALTEANKARSVRDGGARQSILERTTCDRNPDGLINRVTLRYGLDLEGTFQRTITVNAVSAQSDNAGQIKSVAIDAYGIYEDFAIVPGGSTLTWEQNVAATALSYFSKAIAVAERSYDFSLATQLYPGARVTITDNYLVDPTTGTRGVSLLLGWVVSTSFDWSTGVGRVRVVFSPTRATTRLGMWAPSAMVDRDYGGGVSQGGAADSGFSVDDDTLILYKFNETSVPGTGYASAADAGSGGYTLSESVPSAGTENKSYTHIVNGPNASHYARHFPGIANVLMQRNGDAATRTTFLSSWSFEFWLRWDTGNGSLFGYYGPTDSQADNALGNIRVTSGAIDLFWESGSGTNRVTTPAGMSLSADVWTHIGVTVDNSGGTATARFYKDGVLADTKTGIVKADGGTTTTNMWQFGHSVARFSIKDLRFSSIKRSDAEVAASAALTTYQHTLDASTFALWRFNESPDVFDDADYGYHLRKITGTANDVVAPLVQDGGQARHLSSTTVYNGHGYWQDFLDMLAGDWTWETWTTLDAGWATLGVGFWTWNDPGIDSLVTNIAHIYTTTDRKLNINSEIGSGTDVFYETGERWSSDADGQNKMYLVVTKTTTGGLTYLRVYVNGVLVETSSGLGATGYFEGGTDGWLRLASGDNGGDPASPFRGTFDNMRWSTVARTASEIAAAWNFGWSGGYNPVTKQLRLLPHAYSADVDPVDASNFAVGDAIHVVEVSPSSPTNGLSWTDIVASVDTQNSIVTLTTGLAGYDATKWYVLEYDEIDAVVTAQRAKAFIADASTRSTGYADGDAYLWTGDPETTPDEVYVFTQRYRKVNSYSDDTGSAASVHKVHDLSRWAQTAAWYHTAPVLVNQPLTQAVSYGTGSTKRMVFGPVYVPLYYGPQARLEVRLLAASTGAGATVSWRAIMTATLPRGNGSANFDSSQFLDVRSTTNNWVTLSTSSASYVWLTGYIDMASAHPGAPGGSWFLVEASADGGGGTASLKHVYLAEYIENPQTPDSRQETNFLPSSSAVQALTAHATRRRFAEAPYAAGRRRGLP